MNNVSFDDEKNSSVNLKIELEYFWITFQVISFNLDKFSFATWRNENLQITWPLTLA